MSHAQKGIARLVDVAHYILEQLPYHNTTKIRLSCLLYYSYCWSIVWDEKRLFNDRFIRGRTHPVIIKLSEIFGQHPVTFVTHAYLSQYLQAGVRELDDDSTETIDGVLKFYGDKSGIWLSDLSRLEDPFRLTEVGCTIQDNLIYDYYSSIVTESEPVLDFVKAKGRIWILGESRNQEGIPSDGNDC